jgi:hypothetical protein
MPAKSRSTKPSKKTTRKVSKKAAKKVAKKGAKKVAKKAPAMSAEPRHKMIEKAAYYRAERRSFQDGDPVADWLSSEKEVDELLIRN